jgi:glycosyltransferase involved in cell wall biosynthesis
MEFYVQRLSEELAAQGHEVTIFTSSNTLEQSFNNSSNLTIRRLEIMTNVYNVPIVPNLLYQLIDAEKPAVIHTHQYPVFFSDTAAFVCRIKKVPLVLQVHVISDPKSTLSGLISNVYYSSIGLFTLNSADTVIVPSYDYKAKLSKMHVNISKIQVIPYGIDMEEFQFASQGYPFKEKYGCQNSKVLLFVGRLNYQKGLHFLIKAMPTILQQVANVKLLVVGAGEQLADLRQLVASLNLCASVIFTGAIDQKEIHTAYAAADVFVLPSLFESFGISIIEAEASGKPVVATRVGGVPEVLIDGKTGFLVSPCNSIQLAKAILCLLLDSELALKMGEQGRKLVQERFNIKHIVDRLNFQYRKLT